MLIVSPASRAAAPHDRLRVTGGSGSVVVLIDADSAPNARLGEVATVALAAGATLSVVGASWEVALYMISGRAKANQIDLGPDDVVFAPAGTGIEICSDAATQWLVVSNPAAAAAAGAPRIRLKADTPTLAIHDTMRGFLNMSARWPVTGPHAGSTRIAMGQSGFAPNGGAHALHRHHHAAEFLFVLEGQGAHLTEDGEHAMQPGDVAAIPAGEWHGFACRGAGIARAVFGYFGVNSSVDAGYETRETASDI